VSVDRLGGRYLEWERHGNIQKHPFAAERHDVTKASDFLVSALEIEGMERIFAVPSDEKRDERAARAVGCRL
jgi:hypothetical protein